jgi:hypothetical protein
VRSVYSKNIFFIQILDHILILYTYTKLSLSSKHFQFLHFSPLKYSTLIWFIARPNFFRLAREISALQEAARLKVQNEQNSRQQTLRQINFISTFKICPYTIRQFYTRRQCVLMGQKNSWYRPALINHTKLQKGSAIQLRAHILLHNMWMVTQRYWKIYKILIQ